jgi:lipopolysaccharide transport system permease protein
VVVTYVPDNTLRRGYLSLVRDIWRELRDNRFLTSQLFIRDLYAFYKQSLLGVFWVFLVPLVTVGSFVLLRSSGVVAVGTISTPYPIYAVLGLAFWQLFSQGLVAGASSLVAGGDLVARIAFSRKSLVLASMGRAVISFVILIAVAVLLFAYYAATGAAVPLHALGLLSPLAMVPLLLLTVGLSFYLALINGIVRDVATVLAMLLTFVMLLTPVLYERPQANPNADWLSGLGASITTFNPLYYLVVGPRDLILRGELVEPTGFWISSAASAFVFLFGIVSFHLSETRITERI